MHTRTRELVAYGEACGFVLDGSDGRGHVRMVHPNGAVVSVCSTPGEFRGDRNCRADMRRKSGVTPERANSGHYQKHVAREQFVPAQERVDSTSAQYERLARANRAASNALAQMQRVGIRSNTDRAEAARLAKVVIDTEQDIQALGRTAPLPLYRLSD